MTGQQWRHERGYSVMHRDSIPLYYRYRYRRPWNGSRQISQWSRVCGTSLRCQLAELTAYAGSIQARDCRPVTEVYGLSELLSPHTWPSKISHLHGIERNPAASETVCVSQQYQQLDGVGERTSSPARLLWRCSDIDYPTTAAERPPSCRASYDLICLYDV